MSEQEDHEAALFLHLGIQLPDSNFAPLVDFLRTARSYYEAPGGIRLRLLRSRDRPGFYIEVIEYRDVQAWESDQSRVESDGQMRELLEAWHGLLDTEPAVESFEDVTYLLEQGAQA